MTNDSIKATDRCDRCGAQAYVRVSIGTHDLLFCGHHYTANELALMTSGASVTHDERQQLHDAEQRNAPVA